MMFDVGPGILNKMSELGDFPTRSSQWFKGTNGETYSEWGYGLLYDYRAVRKTLESEWIVNYYEIGAIYTPISQEIVSAIDVSNFQSQNLTQYVNLFNPDHIIVRLWHTIEIASGRPHGLAQIASAHSLGYTNNIGGYGWLYRNIRGRDWVYQCLTMLHETHTEIPIFWIDVEPYQDTWPTITDIHSAVEACNFYGVQPGIYTGKWVWDRLGDPQDFSNLPLFHAEYDIEPSLVLRNPYGGWTECAGHQYTSTPIDRSIFNKKYTIKA